MINAYACRWPAGPCGDAETIINAESSGAAKSQFHRQVSEPWPSIRYTDVRCRRIGPAHTSEAFKRNAVYRGMPEVQCGAEVRVGDWTGVIVGHNSSANFDVLATSGPYKGQTVNVHPKSVQVVIGG